MIISHHHHEYMPCARQHEAGGTHPFFCSVVGQFSSAANLKNPRAPPWAMVWSHSHPVLASLYSWASPVSARGPPLAACECEDVVGQRRRSQSQATLSRRHACHIDTSSCAIVVSKRPRPSFGHATPVQSHRIVVSVPSKADDDDFCSGWTVSANAVYCL